MKLSQKIQAMELSPIRKFVPYADAARAAGKKVYGLNIGQPDIKTPRAFFDAVKNFDQEVLAYANSQGEKSLIEALIGYYKRIGIEFENKDILITNGGSEALSMIFTGILDEGDEVIMAEPFYTNYKTFIKAAGGEVVAIPTTADDGYQYAVREKIEGVISPKTKAIAIINPGNPTGKVLTKEEMDLIVDIVVKNDLYLICDEVYREFVYDGKEMSSFGTYKEAEQNVIIVDSVSKRFSACGARIGCMVCKNKEFMAQVFKIAMGRLCVPTLDMVGATAMYKLPADFFNSVRAEYEHRRDVAYDALMKIPGVVCQKPGGAFYITCKLPVENTEDLLLFLLNEFRENNETVMYAPAEGFYATPGLGRDELRIAYILKAEDMARGIELLGKGIEAYKAKGGK